MFFHWFIGNAVLNFPCSTMNSFKNRSMGIMINLKKAAQILLPTLVRWAEASVHQNLETKDDAK